VTNADQPHLPDDELRALLDACRVQRSVEYDEMPPRDHRTGRSGATSKAAPPPSKVANNRRYAPNRPLVSSLSRPRAS